MPAFQPPFNRQAQNGFSSPLPRTQPVPAPATGSSGNDSGATIGQAVVNAAGTEFQ